MKKSKPSIGMEILISLTPAKPASWRLLAYDIMGEDNAKNRSYITREIRALTNKGWDIEVVVGKYDREVSISHDHWQLLVDSFCDREVEGYETRSYLTTNDYNHAPSVDRLNKDLTLAKIAYNEKKAS